MAKISMRINEKMILSDAKELFFQKCKVKNLSEKTIESYSNHFHWLFEYFGEDKIVADISGEDVDSYILYLKNDKNISETSCNSYIRSTRVLFYFCMDGGYMQHFKIHTIKQEETIKETYTDEELEKLLKRPDRKEKSFTTFKTWAFENYLLGTGNRLRTALNVQIKDVDFENGYIYLHKTKNRKEQIIPLSKVLADVLMDYLTIRGGNPDDYFFCDDYGKKANLHTYQTNVRRYNLKRGVNKTSIHMFRHTYAKKAVLNGIDPFRLQKLMGHSSISVTQRYVDLFGSDLQNDYDKFSPLDSLMGTNDNKRIIMRSK